MRVVERNEDKMERAKKRLEDLKGFYWHLAIYILINSLITISKIGSWDALKNDLWNFSTFAVWLFWGIGLAAHASNVFTADFLFGNNWEEKKIQQLMKENME